MFKIYQSPFVLIVGLVMDGSYKINCNAHVNECTQPEADEGDFVDGEIFTGSNNAQGQKTNILHPLNHHRKTDHEAGSIGERRRIQSGKLKGEKRL